MANTHKQETIILFISFMGMAICSTAVLAEEPAAKEVPKDVNKVEYNSEKLRDPFQEEEIKIKEKPQKPGEIKPLPPMQIQGVVWGGSIPLAIINNKVMRVGDSIGNANIIEINKSGVVVLFGDQRHNLSVSSLLTPTPQNKPDGVKNKPKGGKNEKQP